MPQVNTGIRSLGWLKPPIRTLELSDLRLRAGNVTAILDRSLTKAEHAQTLEGASTITLTIRDERRALLRTRLVREAATLVLDGVEYTLVKVSRDGAQMTLILEESVVNILRRYNQPRKANRANTTRAQFVKALVEEPRDVRILVRIPELNERQAIA
jgi:hypothetical protein